MRTLIIRRLDQADLKNRTQWFNNPVVYQQMPIDIPVSLGSTLDWYNGIVANHDRKDFCFEVMEDDKQPFTGAMGGLVAIDQRHSRAELYIVVNPNRLREGIGKVSVQWLCTYGFVFLGLRKIYLYTLATNDAAQSFYENLGFVCEGVLRQHHYHLGKFVDRYIYGLLYEDWECMSGDNKFDLTVDF
jgi:RimJ/RimL family protein N-acetyltransferase